MLLYPDCGVSIVVEILERVEPDASEDAIKFVSIACRAPLTATRFHFDSLVQDNSAQKSQVSLIETLPKQSDGKTPPITRLSGFQDIKKFNRQTEDRVLILMALYRVEEKPIDLVVTFNVPVVSEDGGAVDSDGLSTVQTAFNQFTRSLRIIDFDLFA